MPQINWKHVLLGGLLAGLVLNLFGMGAAHLFLAEQIHSLHQRLQLDQDRSFPMDFLKHLGLRFALGLITPPSGRALALDLARPRSLALPCGYWLTLAAFAWGFLETQAASLAGAWLYREP